MLVGSGIELGLGGVGVISGKGFTEYVGNSVGCKEGKMVAVGAGVILGTIVGVNVSIGVRVGVIKV